MSGASEISPAVCSHFLSLECPASTLFILVVLSILLTTDIPPSSLVRVCDGAVGYLLTILYHFLVRRSLILHTKKLSAFQTD